MPPHWSFIEDEALCRGIVKHDYQPIIGTDRNEKELYDQIFEDFFQERLWPGGWKPSGDPSDSLRKTSAIKRRLRVIQTAVAMFAPLYRQSEHFATSDMNAADIFNAATSMYNRARAVKNCTYFGSIDFCWPILSAVPKWKALGQDTDMMLKAAETALKRTAEVLDNNAVQLEGQLSIQEKRRKHNERRMSLSRAVVSADRARDRIYDAQRLVAQCHITSSIALLGRLSAFRALRRKDNDDEDRALYKQELRRWDQRRAEMEQTITEQEAVIKRWRDFLRKQYPDELAV